jgi:hypothetical protein
MKLLNDTANQHYLSQVEQRLNTCNPTAIRRNQKIYAFEIQKRGTSDEIKLGPATQKPIAGNLTLHDLFSFDVEPKSNLRQNFEALFQRYEESLRTHTEALLKKAEVRSADISDELIALFSAKLLNFMRNPYSIPKMLDTFKGFAGLRPVDPNQDRFLQLVLNGRKPHQKAMCRRLGLSDTQYLHWLGTMFLMLHELSPGKETMFDGMVRNLFTNKDYSVEVMISMYSTENCLLSDRSFSTNLQVLEKDGMDFNLRHNAFIRYVFARRTALLPSDTPPDLIAMSRILEPRITVHYSVDDMTQLRYYNQNVINQSHSRVFCASNAGILF